MPTVHQTDDAGLLQWTRDEYERGHLQVSVTPPVVPDGHVARWVTDLHPVTDMLTYGTAGTGHWETVEDHREAELWLGHQQRYTLGEEHEGQTYDGLGPLPEWLHADEPPAPEPTPEEIEAAKVALVQEHMDAAARALRYDDIKTACTYADEPSVPKFQAEGLAFRVWRSQVWAACYAILADVQSGLRGVPTDSELLAELPALELPSGSEA